MSEQSFNILELIINITLTVTTISISLFAVFKTISDNKRNLEISLFSNIHQAKINFDNALYDCSKLDKRKIRRNQLMFDPLIEDYVNALNIACIMYQNRSINKNRFKLMFKSEVITVCNDSLYKPILDNDIGAFDKLIQTSKEFCN